MATYRCPECGASHKDLVSHCRLCGAPIENPITVRNVTVDRSVSAERFRPKTLNHFIWIGLGIAAIVIIGAFATGTAHNSTISRWWHKVPGVPEAVEDAWFEWPDPNEKMVVEVPALPEAPPDDEALDLGGDSTETWKTTLGDAQIFLGYTEGLGFETSEDTLESDTTAAFRDAAEAMADQQNGRVAQVGDIFRRDGHWVSNVIIDELSLPEGVAYGSARMVMSDSGDIYFVETIDYQRDPDSQKRMRNSLVIVADTPDATIPTLPAGVSGGDEG